jgi:catechol 2,3-dioxygenase
MRPDLTLRTESQGVSPPRRSGRTPSRYSLLKKGCVSANPGVLSSMHSPSPTRSDATTRLPDRSHIGRVRLSVGDLGRSLRLYRDLLGLRVVQDEGQRITLAAPADNQQSSVEEPRELIVLEERPGIRRRPQRPRTTGLYHVALLIPSRGDLGRTILALDNAGYPLRGMSDHAVSESLYLDDPDGNGLEIYADRPREQWPIQDGVVQMTVEPMDIEGVIGAAKENPGPWAGLSHQTVVGHVHFTVSDMERAVAYYRDVVGFDVMMRIPSLTAVSAGGYHHHLNLNTWAGEGAPQDSEDVAGLTAWELRVPREADRIALLQRLGTEKTLTDSSATAVALDPDLIPMEIRSS